MDEMKFRFKPLTPERLTDELNPYLDVFDYSLAPDNSDVKNIAVTGGYGAGKSSVIQSYLEKRNLKDKTLNISLATFDLKDSKGKVIENELDLDAIEFNILQQITHQVHPNKVPKSRFERIIEKIDLQKEENAFFYVMLATFFILVTSLYIAKFVFDKEILLNYGFILFSIAVYISSLYFLAKYLVHSRLFFSKHIDSIDIMGKASFKSEAKISPLNLFIDEILYFFEVTQYSIVVFEDLDRLSHREILIRLREINQFINNSEQVSRTVKFIYAIKDDLFFEQEARVKFFDFIIPIIPVMDYGNSYQLIKDSIYFIMGDTVLLKILDEGHLLRDVSLYITDKRLLNNILNEYIIYLKKDNIKINNDSFERLRKIFALVVYKNFMPEDFGRIKNKNSILCKVIECYRKKKYFSKQIEIWEKTLKDKKIELTSLSSVESKKIDDLKVSIVDNLLFPESIRNIPIKRSTGYKFIDFTYQNKVAIFDEEIERNKTLNIQITFMVNDQNYKAPSIHKDTVNQYLDEYDEQKLFLEEKEAEKDIILRKEIMTLEAKVNKHYPLADRIKIYREIDRNDDWEKDFYNPLPNDEIGNTEDLEIVGNKVNQKLKLDNYAEKPIIFMLLRRGYIDHSYINYLSLSHDNAEELIFFRRAIADNKPYLDTFNLDLNDELIARFLKEDKDVLYDYLTTESILNFSLISYLASSNDVQQQDYLKGIIKFHFTKTENFKFNFLLSFISEKLRIKNTNRIVSENIEEVHQIASPIAFPSDLRGFLKVVFENNNNSLNNLIVLISEKQLSEPSNDLIDLLLLLLILIDERVEENLSASNRNKLKKILLKIDDFVNAYDRVLWGVRSSGLSPIEWITNLNIKISLTQPFLDNDVFSKTLFDNLVKTSSYEIDIKNIFEIYLYYGKPTEALEDKPYTSLIENFDDTSPIRKYIEENIVEYFKKVLIKTSKKESKEALLLLINNMHLTNGHVLNLIRKQDISIVKDIFIKISLERLSHIDENEQSFYELLLQMDSEHREENITSIIEANWLNVFRMLSITNVKTKLVEQWLSSVYKEIDKYNHNIETSSAFNSLKKFVLFNNNFDKDIYYELVSSLGEKVSDENIDDLEILDWEKLEILMHLDLIEVSSETINKIYEIYLKMEEENE
ncbi:hypothetical protein MMG00_04075 [Ignatzschineria rhizosphaerae]|uniref:YobI-like P-loop NTPase domain-containing protein n=1 Tax=Ignatzschineria rhizosphaerae TaxID=2923279 RepID=A0ABY3XAQ6_9GAMM|nr:hypothetical protein [Ignatzschineria rhizosphaerae]UNM97038.1 hypothetical protein MMG00_04075 [Ignatzschineria rhizosphaerae]